MDEIKNSAISDGGSILTSLSPEQFTQWFSCRRRPTSWLRTPRLENTIYTVLKNLTPTTF